MPGLLRSVARTAVVAGTATGVARRVAHHQDGRWARQSAEQAPAEAAPEPAEQDNTDRLAQLRELGELKNQGVLTDAEFEQEKRRILGS
jgi:transcription initiation factor TFIID subunit TAF12